MVWGGKFSDLEKRCIASWSELLPEYQIIRWDESNFNIEEHPFAKEAYKAGKWAFVSDYVRIWILLNYGGVYLDTDYEIVGSIDKYLKKNVFIGLENSEYVGTAIIGAEKGHWLMREKLDYYDTHPFIISKSKYNMIPNTMVMTDILIRHGYKRGTTVEIDGVYVGARNVFYGEGSDKEAVGIHYFRGSWWSEKERARSKSKSYKRIKPFLVKGKKAIAALLGADRARNIEMKIKNFLK